MARSNKISQECLNAAKEALSSFTNVDLEEYVISVFRKAREYEDLRGSAGIRKAIDEINNQYMQNFMEDLQTKVNDADKFNSRKRLIEDKVPLLNMIVRRENNKSENIESAQSSASKRLMDVSINQLSGDEFKFLLDSRNTKEIIAAIDGKKSSPIAEKIANVFKKYIEIRSSEVVNSGALPLEAINKDRFLRAIHDESKILKGGRTFFDALGKKKYTVEQSRGMWKERIKKFINIDKTFDKGDVHDINGNVDESKLDDALNTIFDNITVGNPELVKFNLKRRQMFFYWKDMSSWYEYNKIYGKGDLANAWISDVNSSGNTIGLHEFFGSSPAGMYNDLAKLENKTNPVSRPKKALTKLEFDYVAMPHKLSTVPLISNIQALTSTSRLAGRMSLLNMSDLGNGVLYAHRYGYNMFKSYGTYLRNSFNLFPTEERKYLASMFKEMISSHLTYVSRYAEASNISQVLNKFNSFLYKATLSSAQDYANKLSAIQITARMLGDSSNLYHSQLKDGLKKLLNTFNISEKEWNMLRTKSTEVGGKKLFSLDNLKYVSNEELRQVYGVKEDKPLWQLKNDLHRKVYSLFDVSADNVVLQPGSFMNAITKHDFHNPVFNSLFQSIMQFKKYPLEFADRVLFQGLKSSDGVKNKLLFAGAYAASMVPLSWLVMNLDYISQGKSLPDWDKMTVNDKIVYSKNLFIPSLGFLSNFLNPNDQSPASVGNYITTPTIKVLNSILTGSAALAESPFTGDFKKVEKSLKNIAEGITPGMGMPFLAPYMHTMYGDKPYLMHGQQQEFGA